MSGPPYPELGDNSLDLPSPDTADAATSTDELATHHHPLKQEAAPLPPPHQASFPPAATLSSAQSEQGPLGFEPPAPAVPNHHYSSPIPPSPQPNPTSETPTLQSNTVTIPVPAEPIVSSFSHISDVRTHVEPVSADLASTADVPVTPNHEGAETNGFDLYSSDILSRGRDEIEAGLAAAAAGETSSISLPVSEPFILGEAVSHAQAEPLPTVSTSAPVLSLPVSVTTTAAPSPAPVPSQSATTAEFLEQIAAAPSPPLAPVSLTDKSTLEDPTLLFAPAVTLAPSAPDAIPPPPSQPLPSAAEIHPHLPKLQHVDSSSSIAVQPPTPGLGSGPTPSSSHSHSFATSVTQVPAYPSPLNSTAPSSAASPEPVTAPASVVVPVSSLPDILPTEEKEEQEHEEQEEQEEQEAEQQHQQPETKMHYQMIEPDSFQVEEEVTSYPESSAMADAEEVVPEPFTVNDTASAPLITSTTDFVGESEPEVAAPIVSNSFDLPPSQIQLKADETSDENGVFKMEEDDVVVPVGLTVGETSSKEESPGVLLKRTAPEDEAAEEADSKRQKLEGLEVPEVVARPSASPTPVPVQGFDPSAFHTAPIGVPTPTAPVEPIKRPISSTGESSHREGPVSVISKDQLKFGLSLLRTLKKHRSAPPFLRPVDPVALLIPDYPKVITRPMDLGTIESKLNATAKAMANHQKNGRIFGLDYSGVGEWEGKSDKVYRTAEEFKEDVERVWENCYRYNGPKEKNPVSAMAGAMQEVCERMWRTMPSAPAIEYKPAVTRLATPPAPPSPSLSPSATTTAHASSSVPPPPPPPSHRPQAVASSPESPKKERRPSNSVPTIRRSEDGPRPKREIHAPAKDLPYFAEEAAGGAGLGGKSKQGRVSGKMAQEQLRFCRDVIKEMFKKVHKAYAYPFYTPVDYVALNIPQYPQVVKQPMDLGTIRTKLDQSAYPIPPFEGFQNDMRLIFKNCYAFNPPGTAVHDWGKKVEKVFEDKWATRPMTDPEVEDLSEDDDAGITEMERQLQTLQANLEAMKQKKKDAKEAKRVAQAARSSKANTSSSKKSSSSHSQHDAKRRPSVSNTAPNRKRSTGGGGAHTSSSALKKSKARKSALSSDDDRHRPLESVSFEMKRELAVKIVSFEGENLERAIDIIRQGKPELLNDSNKEIELDIDQLDQKTLLALYRFVCPPAPSSRKQPTKQQQASSKRTATGGSKRKNLDEMKESERIEMLEARLRDFENGGKGDGGHADQASSDSSSDEESGSESEED